MQRQVQSPFQDITKRPQSRWFRLKEHIRAELGILRLKGQLLPHPHYSRFSRGGWVNLYWSGPNSFAGELKHNRAKYARKVLRGLWQQILHSLR